MIKRIIRGIVIIFFVLVLGSIVVSEFPQLYVVPFTKYKLSNIPGAYYTFNLRALEPAQFQAKNLKEFLAFGYSVVLPWQESEIIERRNVHAVFFQSGNKQLIAFDEEPDIFLLMQGENGIQQEDLVSFYGKDVTKSRYEFYRYILNLTPNDLKIFAPKRESLSKSVLVIFKSITVWGEGPFYEFDTNHIRGFQYGNLINGKSFIVDFFTPNDKRFRILFSGIEDQREVDFIIQ